MKFYFAVDNTVRKVLVHNIKATILRPAGKFTGVPAFSSAVFHQNKWLSAEIQALALKGLKAGQGSKIRNINVLGWTGRWEGGDQEMRGRDKHVYCVTGEKSSCSLASYINFSLPDSCYLPLNICMCSVSA